MVPHFSVRSRELSAIGVGRFHPGIAVLLDQGDLETLLGQGVGGGDAGDTGADDGDVMHAALSSEAVKTKGRRACTMHTLRPPLF